MSWLFSSGGQSIGASALATLLPMNTQGWFPLGLTGLISLQFKGLSTIQHQNSKASILQHSALFTVQLSHLYVTTGKTIASTIGTFVSKMVSLFFNKLSRCHSFPFKEQVSFNFVAAVTVHSDLGAQENKICHCFQFSPFYLPWSDGTGCHDLRFLNVEFQASFFALLFHPHQETL